MSRAGRVLAGLAVAGACSLGARAAGAAGFTDYGADLESPPKIFELDGYFRTRGSLFYNLDLDRGPTPSGEIFFPVPEADPTAQALSLADMRLRADLRLYAPGGGLALKLRLDALDNVALGSAPEGIPAAATTQGTTGALLTVRRVYAEALTPLGLVTVGRMGHHFGLGMLANGGDCADCDGGDVADRAALVVPLLGHLWALAYDLTSVGPTTRDKTDLRVVALEPTTFVHNLSFAVLGWRGPEARARRTQAGKVTPEYGAFVSHRFQKNDVPASYLPTAQPVPIDAAQIMARGYAATAVDMWGRVEGPGFRFEAEAAYLHAVVAQPSLIPGVLYRDPVTSNAWGMAFEGEVGDEAETYRIGLDAGVASGDAAPGFGAFPKAGAAASQPGDLDGPQANPPFDTTVDNFRFSSDYRIDRILFREILGTVTDAFYFRPRIRGDVYRGRHSKLELALAAVTSFAFRPESAPGAERPLGIEIDPTVRYTNDVGVEAALEQATLLPLAGLDNPALGLRARPAQLWRLRLTYGF
ncbi:MAG: hypothetical protein IT373_35140 [Polyangiaceae bacterium]|nr:hypothetical protein [Polyangiaceae bacterium]